MAAELSGYSRRQLRRLVAERKLRNVGTGNEHRYRVAELPKKPGHRVRTAEGPSSKGQIARAVARGENG
ncbi:MAG TPA: hypothetical protein VML95_09530 [Longimicrobiales bacterium]|nr:hypothetical protein [Longimicrobiales bacterium]